MRSRLPPGSAPRLTNGNCETESKTQKAQVPAITEAPQAARIKVKLSRRADSFGHRSDTNRTLEAKLAEEPSPVRQRLSGGDCEIWRRGRDSITAISSKCRYILYFRDNTLCLRGLQAIPIFGYSFYSSLIR
jgi:hypothetical protein